MQWESEAEGQFFRVDDGKKANLAVMKILGTRVGRGQTDLSWSGPARNEKAGGEAHAQGRDGELTPSGCVLSSPRPGVCIYNAAPVIKISLCLLHAPSPAQHEWEAMVSPKENSGRRDCRLPGPLADAKCSGWTDGNSKLDRERGDFSQRPPGHVTLQRKPVPR